MPAAAPSTAALFTVLVLVVAMCVGYALRRASVGALPSFGILLAYLVLPGLLAARGALDRYDPLPAPALLLVLGVVLLTITLAFTTIGGRLAAAIPLGAVVSFQAFRIPVEALLHRLSVEGAIPVHMTWSGGNLDVISGITGLALGAWLLGGRAVPRGVVLAWNLLGLVLLANIVVVAALSTPVPFRRFLEGPPNLLPSVFPFVWLPSFLVQVALASHLIVFRQLGGRS